MFQGIKNYIFQSVFDIAKLLKEGSFQGVQWVANSKAAIIEPLFTPLSKTIHSLNHYSKECEDTYNHCVLTKKESFSLISSSTFTFSAISYLFNANQPSDSTYADIDYKGAMAGFIFGFSLIALNKWIDHLVYLKKIKKPVVDEITILSKSQHIEIYLENTEDFNLKIRQQLVCFATGRDSVEGCGQFFNQRVPQTLDTNKELRLYFVYKEGFQDIRKKISNSPLLSHASICFENFQGKFVIMGRQSPAFPQQGPGDSSRGKFFTIFDNERRYGTLGTNQYQGKRIDHTRFTIEEVEKMLHLADENISTKQGCDMYSSNCFTSAIYLLTRAIVVIDERQQNVESDNMAIKSIYSMIKTYSGHAFAGHGLSNNRDIHQAVEEVLDIMFKRSLIANLPMTSPSKNM